MDDVLLVVIGRTVGAAVAAAALTLLLNGCAGSATPSEPPQDWDPDRHLKESSQQLAEMLGIADPPEVEVERFILPTEDHLWVDCLNQAGYDFESGVDGGLIWPDDQRPEIMEAMNLAFYTCAETYPMDPKYSAPETEERLKWMYRYKSTTMLACFEEQGYPYNGTPPSEQVYVDSEGEWSPYASLSSHTEYDVLSAECPQVPAEYYEQSFW